MAALLSLGLLPGGWALLSMGAPLFPPRWGIQPQLHFQLERTDSRLLKDAFFFFFCHLTFRRGLQLGAG